MLRSLIAVLAVSLVPAAWPDAGGDATPDEPFVFELTGNSKIFAIDGPLLPGVPPEVDKDGISGVLGCLGSESPQQCGAADGELPEIAYVAWRSTTEWELRSAPDGPAIVTLTGLVDGKGRFLMTGSGPGNGFTFVLEGRAKFAKETLDPVKIRGRMQAVNRVHDRFSVGRFKTKGAAVLGPLI